jgi:hypothetical protein
VGLQGTWGRDMSGDLTLPSKWGCDTYNQMFDFLEEMVEVLDEQIIFYRDHDN